jgi:hypothetical protein
MIKSICVQLLQYGQLSDDCSHPPTISATAQVIKHITGLQVDSLPDGFKDILHTHGRSSSATSSWCPERSCDPVVIQYCTMQSCSCFCAVSTSSQDVSLCFSAALLEASAQS